MPRAPAITPLTLAAHDGILTVTAKTRGPETTDLAFTSAGDERYLSIAEQVSDSFAIIDGLPGDAVTWLHLRAGKVTVAVLRTEHRECAVVYENAHPIAKSLRRMMRKLV